ncbi:hypothetical protein D3C84_1192620 [compost metagenome]
MARLLIDIRELMAQVPVLLRLRKLYRLVHGKLYVMAIMPLYSLLDLWFRLQKRQQRSWHKRASSFAS